MSDRPHPEPPVDPTDVDPRVEIADLLDGFPNGSDEELDAASKQWSALTESEQRFHAMRVQIAQFRMLDALRKRMTRLERGFSLVVQAGLDGMEALGGWDAIVAELREIGDAVKRSRLAASDPEPAAPPEPTQAAPAPAPPSRTEPTEAEPPARPAGKFRRQRPS